jgi:hypothetical protein
MTIASLDDIVAAYGAGQVLDSTFLKNGTAAELAGWPHSLWRVGPLPAAGGDGAVGSGTPGAGGTALTTADGSLSLGWANQDPLQKFLLNFDAVASVDGLYVLVDRLVSVSGIALSSTGNKNVGSAALPRYTDGVGVRAWLEVTTATTTTAPIVSMNSYTDQSGNTGSVGGSVTFPATATNVDTLIPLPLASGDYGVRACSTINVATAAAAGVANFVLTKEIARLPLEDAAALSQNLLGDVQRFPRIFDGASLMLYYIPTAGTAISIDGNLSAVYG